jgi:hypothetical protein
MKCRDDELVPEGADFGDHSERAVVAINRRWRGRGCDGCHGAFYRLPGDFRARKNRLRSIVATAVLAGLIKKLFLLSGLAQQPMLALLNC